MYVRILISLLIGLNIVLFVLLHIYVNQTNQENTIYIKKHGTWETNLNYKEKIEFIKIDLNRYEYEEELEYEIIKTQFTEPFFRHLDFRKLEGYWILNKKKEKNENIKNDSIYILINLGEKESNYEINIEKVIRKDNEIIIIFDENKNEIEEEKETKYYPNILIHIKEPYHIDTTFKVTNTYQKEFKKIN